MQRLREPTCLTKDTVFAVTTFGCRADMAIYALGILAIAAVGTRCHASYKAQGSELLLCRFVLVRVGAVITVAAFVTQIVDIAHLELLDAVNFGLVVLDGRIHTLVTTISSD